MGGRGPRMAGGGPPMGGRGPRMAGGEPPMAGGGPPMAGGGPPMAGGGPPMAGGGPPMAGGKAKPPIPVPGTASLTAEQRAMLKEVHAKYGTANTSKLNFVVQPGSQTYDITLK
jgi:hypothetical protein